jgi:hypothetical protein
MNYKLIPMDKIHDEARKIAVAWVEDYEPSGFDLPNKHKLASDIQNFANTMLENKITKFNQWLADNHSSFEIPDRIIQDYLKWGEKR